jgi:hypothetical protein
MSIWTRIDAAHDHLFCLVEALHDEFRFGRAPTLLIGFRAGVDDFIPLEVLDAIVRLASLGAAGTHSW